MKTEAQIKHKLAQVRFRHRSRELRNGLSRKSSNCAYNGRVELPLYGQVGVCLYGAEKTESWNGGVCDELVGGDRAGKCELFVCSRSKDDLKEEFDAFLRTSSRAEVAARYPDMAALLWALDSEPETIVPEASEESEDSPGSEPAPLPEEVYKLPPPPDVPEAPLPGTVRSREAVVLAPQSGFWYWIDLFLGWFRG